jgi:hypothetical protein
MLNHQHHTKNWEEDLLGLVHSDAFVLVLYISIRWFACNCLNKCWRQTTGQVGHFPLVELSASFFSFFSLRSLVQLLGPFVSKGMQKKKIQQGINPSFSSLFYSFKRGIVLLSRMKEDLRLPLISWLDNLYFLGLRLLCILFPFIMYMFFLFYHRDPLLQFSAQKI